MNSTVYSIYLNFLQSKLYKTKPTLSSDEAMVREGGTVKERQTAKDELVNFAQQTYNALMSEQPGSSLWFMCRIDIGVMMNPKTERFEYFVNEVEQGNSICIFGMISNGEYVTQRFGDETREVVLELLDEHFGKM